MRSCFHCSRLRKTCRVASDSKKCLECIHLDHFCDLISFDIDQYRRLEEQRRKLKIDLRETIARQQRLMRQLKFMKNEQQMMINVELQNIEELNQEKRASLSLKSIIDVLFEQVTLSNVFDD